MNILEQATAVVSYIDEKDPEILRLSKEVFELAAMIDLVKTQSDGVLRWFAPSACVDKNMFFLREFILQPGKANLREQVIRKLKITCFPEHDQNF